MMEGKYRNMWQYARSKTHEIGVRGVFAGWSLSFIRDSIGFGAFFGAFEFVKGQCFYSFVSNVYGFYDKLSSFQKTKIATQESTPGRPEIRPHYMLEPSFILLAGAAASIAQSVIQHPITRIQDVHYGRLEWIDSHRHVESHAPKVNALSMYASAYKKTFKECAVRARRSGGLRKWLYADFLMGTLRQVPSTSAGLIVFEIVRRKYSLDEEAVRIRKDGYDILLV
jgi:heme/copper-type cytochrome/quinol oxidase subunit 3